MSGDALKDVWRGICSELDAELGESFSAIGEKYRAAMGGYVVLDVQGLVWKVAQTEYMEHAKAYWRRRNELLAVAGYEWVNVSGGPSYIRMVGR